jgi:hypothetical protein
MISGSRISSPASQARLVANAPLRFDLISTRSRSVAHQVEAARKVKDPSAGRSAGVSQWRCIIRRSVSLKFGVIWKFPSLCLWLDRLKAAWTPRLCRYRTPHACPQGRQRGAGLHRGGEPKNEIEAALATQMACTHAVTMAVLSRAGGGYGGDRHVTMMALATARPLNAFVNQVETMRRLRNGGTQVIRVEKIEVSDTAQAVIGNINSQRHEV